MTDVSPTDPVGKIEIIIEEGSVSYESEMTIPEIVFWLEMTLQMVLNNVINPQGEVNAAS